MNIIIEFHKDVTNTKAISQAVKIFLKKNARFNSFTLVGPGELVTTLNAENRVKIISIDDETKAIKEALKLSLEKDNVLVAYSSIIKVNEEAKKVLKLQKNNKTTITGTRFPIVVPGKYVYLVNIDKINDEKVDTLVEGEELFNKYLLKFSKDKGKTYKLLVPHVLDKEETLLDKEFKKDPFYKGTLDAVDFLDPNCDIVISYAKYFDLVLDTFKTTLITRQKLYEEGIKGSSIMKMGNYFVKSANQQMDFLFDKDTRSEGTILLGYENPIIFARSDISTNGLLKIIETAKY